MLFNGTATRDQLTVLRDVLQDYCQEHDITDDMERNEAAEMVMSIFARGVTTYEGIRTGMEDLARNRLRHRPWFTGSDEGSVLPG